MPRARRGFNIPRRSGIVEAGGLAAPSRATKA
jgi:hypothetical protein